MESGGLPTAADFSPQVAEPACQPAHFGPRLVLKTARRSVTGSASSRTALECERRSRVSQIFQGSPAKAFSALGLLVQTEAWPPGASHHWSRAVKLDRKVTTEGSWTGVPCKALPPIQLERTETAARREITPIFAPFRAHPKDREQEEHPWKLRAATFSEDPQAKQDSSCLTIGRLRVPPDREPSKRRNSRSSPPGSLLVGPSRLDRRASKA